jgi:DNA-binding NtrC family response regulator
MLKDHVHGLDVIESLRVVSPELRAILMTGFASADLRADAEYADVFDFIEKPFPMDRIRSAVGSALAAAPALRREHPIAVFEVTTDNKVAYANRQATEILKNAKTGSAVGSLSELFSSEELLRLREATEGWVKIPISQWLEERPQQRGTWLLRAKEIPDTGHRLIVLVDSSNESFCSNPLVQRILELPEVSAPAFEPAGHILVIDDLESIRRIAVDLLRECNFKCHGAQTHEEAIRIFAHDSDVRYVLIDYEMSRSNPLALIKRFRSLRPEVEIIGTGSEEHRKDFESIGVNSFIPKPWTVPEFLEVFADTVKS